MIQRTLYIDKIKAFIDKPFIKVISGIRRSGKSSILLLLKNEILQKGVDEQQILFINFESFNFADIKTGEQLYTYVKERIVPGKRQYILLDEIQEVTAWEKAVNSFMLDFDVDLYITGSNSHLLSSELATFLAGRYVEFQIQTLTFRECLSFNTELQNSTKSKLEKFDYFLRIGGFPVLHTSNYSLESAYKIVYDIYSSAILRDTVQRYKIRDVELLERIVKYVFDNIGNSFSAKNIADYFKSQQRKIDLNTVYNYLNALESAFIIHRIQRYDVKGKELLKTQEKYFVSDPALVYAVMGYKDRMISGILENIVLLELLSRDYDVAVGKVGTKEIDFIASKGNAKFYIQVAYMLPEPATVEREFTPLLELKDHYPKYVVTMDPLWIDSIEGVKHIHIADFLLMESYD
jgi:predicted AAA+ superfamily ATPase